MTKISASHAAYYICYTTSYISSHECSLYPIYRFIQILSSSNDELHINLDPEGTGNLRLCRQADYYLFGPEEIEEISLSKFAECYSCYSKGEIEILLECYNLKYYHP